MCNWIWIVCFVVVTDVMAADMAVHEKGNGMSHTVTIECPDRFRLVFEAEKNYGITQWYDLASDPDGKRDLLKNPTDYIPMHAQGAIFNQCLNPDDLIAHVASGGSLHKDVPRAFRILKRTPATVVVESRYSPMLGKANPDLVFTTRYEIDTSGRIDIHNTMRAKSPQTITMWRNAIITLGDPTYQTNNQEGLTAELIAPTQLRVAGVKWQPDQWRGYVVGQSEWRAYDVVSNTIDVLTVKLRSPAKVPDSGEMHLRSNRTRYGWLRNDSISQPVGYQNESADYIFAHWDAETPAPYKDWTQASILLLPHVDNAQQGHGGRLHGWRGCKRLYYETAGFTLKEGQTVTQQYRIHLGSSANSALPDLSSPQVCKSLAAVYRRQDASKNIGKVDKKRAADTPDDNGTQ
jgi:hypothetical protein